MTIDSALITELEIVAHRGAETASSSLSSLLGHPVAVNVSGVELTDIEMIPERMGRGELLTAGLISRVMGDVTGNSLLLLDEIDALRLVDTLGADDKNTDLSDFGDLEQSMLEETANITISSFMNSMTSHLNRKCVPNAPIYLLDLAGAILSVILMESAEAADQAIIFSTNFVCKEQDMKALFVFLPNPASLAALEEGLNEA